MTFLHPVSDQRLPGVPGHDPMLLGFSSFCLPFPDELLLLLLDLVCQFTLSVNIITREGGYRGGCSDGVTALGSERTEVNIV